MGTQTPSSSTQRLADHLLDGQLEDYVRSRRAGGKSWRRISLDLRDDVGVDVSHETVRNWFAEPVPGDRQSA